MVTFSGEYLNLLIAAWFYPFARVMAMFAAAPLFDQRAIPITVKIGLASVIAIILVPLLPAAKPINDQYAVGVLFQQIIIGLSIGFSMKIVFTAFQMAGDIIGLQMGLGFAQFVDPDKGNSSPLIGSLLTILASLIFLSMDGHLMLIDIIVRSFSVVPIGAATVGVRFENMVQAAGILFMLGLQISLPVVAALMVSNLILGILTKASPQMNLMSVGFSITIVMGVLVLSYSTPYLVSTFGEAITRMTEVSILKPVHP